MWCSNEGFIVSWGHKDWFMACICGRKRRRRRRRMYKQGWIDSATHRNLQTSPKQVYSLPHFFFFIFSIQPAFIHPLICSLWLWIAFTWNTMDCSHRQELSLGFGSRLETFFLHWVKNIFQCRTEAFNRPESDAICCFMQRKILSLGIINEWEEHPLPWQSRDKLAQISICFAAGGNSLCREVPHKNRILW